MRTSEGSTDKVFSRLDKVDIQNRREWSGEFKVALKRASREAHWFLEETESQPQAEDMEDAEVEEDFQEVGIQKWAAEVYDSLSMLLKGDTFVTAGGVRT